MLRTIHLHGALAKQFAPSYRLAVETPAEGLRGIMCQVKGFEQAIREGEFVCIRGSLDEGVECDVDLLKMNFGGCEDFHIIPAAVGRKSGAGKILLGILMIGAVFLTGGMAIASFGVAATAAEFGAITFGGLIFSSALSALAVGVGAVMVLSGAAQLLSPMPTGGDTGTDTKAGYLFNGAINTAEQGGACPLVFGRIRAGSVVVSAGITAERIPTAVDGTGSGYGGKGGASGVYGDSGKGDVDVPTTDGYIEYSTTLA